MTQITLPDNIPLPQLVRALHTIGLRPIATDKLTFDHANQPKLAEQPCAAPGCNRTGSIRWGDDNICWCGEHAWSQRGRA